MRRGIQAGSVALMLLGAVWFLQGIGLLPGSFMTGQMEWAVAGALAAAIGVGLLVYANRLPSPPGP
ncbi:MAG: hypothetical protein ACE5NC_05540 [Anaerolineae bacterium]